MGARVIKILARKTAEGLVFVAKLIVSAAEYLVEVAGGE